MSDKARITIGMKQEYNFSNGERGKFYNAEAQLEIPIDLEPDAASFLNGAASQKGAEVKTFVHDWIQKDSASIETILLLSRDAARDASRS